MLAVWRRSLVSHLTHPFPSQQLQLLSVALLPSLSNGLTSQLGIGAPESLTSLRGPSDVACHPTLSRQMFSLPGFDDDLAKKYKERKLLGYSPQQMYDVVAAVEHYKDFVPWCQDSTVILRRDDTYLEAELQVGFQIFVEKYLSKVTLHPSTHITSHVGESTLFSHLDSSWRFQPGPTPQSVYLTFDVDFAFKSPLYRQVASLFFEEVVQRMMAAFEGRCRKLYGVSSLSGHGRPHHHLRRPAGTQS